MHSLIGMQPVIIPSLMRSSPHTKIERITLPNVSLARRDQTDAYEIRRRRMARFNPHEKWVLLAQFLQRHREKLPALAEIRILGQFDWPVNRCVNIVLLAFAPYTPVMTTACHFQMAVSRVRCVGRYVGRVGIAPVGHRSCRQGW